MRWSRNVLVVADMNASLSFMCFIEGGWLALVRAGL